MRVLRMNSSSSQDGVHRFNEDGGSHEDTCSPCCKTRPGKGEHTKSHVMTKCERERESSFTSKYNNPYERTAETGKEESPRVIRLLVLGGHGVGKSAVTVRYLTRRFIGEYKSQVDIIYRQTTQIDGVKVDLEIIDISSRPGDDTLPTLEICQCDCYLVVYSVAERHTFLAANHLLRAIFKLRSQLPTPPITLLGNKQDLEHSRQVSREEGESTSKVFGCDFAEVSVAETSEEIVPVFTSLLRRTRRKECLCTHSDKLPEVPTIHGNSPLSSRISPCYCSCQHTFLIDSQICRHCGCSGDQLNNCVGTDKIESNTPKYFSNESTRSLPRTMSAPRHATVTRQASERTNRKVSSRSSSKKQVLPSSNTSLQKKGNGAGNTSSHRMEKPLKNTSNISLQRTSSKEKNKMDRKVETKYEAPLKHTLKVPSFIPVHTPLSRSHSSPESWPKPSHNSPNACGTNSFTDICEVSSAKATKEIKHNVFFESLNTQDPSLSLLSRGRSFVLDTSRSKRNFECSCGTQNRSGSFKSSGKVEIVTIKNPKVNIKSGNTSNPRSQANGNVGSDKPSLPKFGKKFKTGSNCSSLQDVKDNVERASASTPSTTRSLKFSKKLLSTMEPLENSTNTASADARGPDTTAARQRKFSVFGRALGNFLSKGSLPDLPRATANICDKFGSLKKTIKKRSV